MTVYHFLGNRWATTELLAKGSTGQSDEVEHKMPLRGILCCRERQIRTMVTHCEQE
jgi:hypothetical protein